MKFHIWTKNGKVLEIEGFLCFSIEAISDNNYFLKQRRLEMDLKPISSSKVYLISYFMGENEQGFEPATKPTEFFIVTGGPVPIRTLKAEMGVKIYKVPSGDDPFTLAKEIGGYVAKGYVTEEPVKRSAH